MSKDSDIIRDGKFNRNKIITQRNKIQKYSGFFFQVFVFNKNFVSPLKMSFL